MKIPTVDEMQAMFRAHTEAAVKVIVEIMTTGTGAKGEAVRLAAAKEILNRGWGRPAGHKEGAPKDKDAAKAHAAPEWRNKDGKTYAQLYAEKEAENAAAAAAKPPASLPLPVARPGPAAATPALR